jgi:hypothetical protein
LTIKIFENFQYSLLVKGENIYRNNCLNLYQNIFIIYFLYFLSIFEVSNSSDVTSSVTSLVSVKAFFFITASSLTYGFFDTCASYLVRGTSTVLVSVTGFLVIVA